MAGPGRCSSSRRQRPNGARGRRSGSRIERASARYLPRRRRTVDLARSWTASTQRGRSYALNGRPVTKRATRSSFDASAKAGAGPSTSACRARFRIRSTRLAIHRAPYSSPTALTCPMFSAPITPGRTACPSHTPWRSARWAPRGTSAIRRAATGSCRDATSSAERPTRDGFCARSPMPSRRLTIATPRIPKAACCPIIIRSGSRRPASGLARSGSRRQYRRSRQVPQPRSRSRAEEAGVGWPLRSSGGRPDCRRHPCAAT